MDSGRAWLDHHLDAADPHGVRASATNLPTDQSWSAAGLPWPVSDRRRGTAPATGSYLRITARSGLRADD